MTRKADQAEERRDRIGAQGKLLAFLAAVLQRAGVIQTGDFASLLEAFAETVAESDPGEGQLLAAWTAAVRAAQRN